MQKYSLELSRQAESILERMIEREPELAKRVAQALDDLEYDPFQGKPLKGKLKGLNSYRVGSYRIIYEIYRHRLRVVIIDIGHRRDIYR